MSAWADEFISERASLTTRNEQVRAKDETSATFISGEELNVVTHN